MVNVKIIQPVIPSYRIGFFDRLNKQFGVSFVVYASQKDMGVLTRHAQSPIWQKSLGSLRPLFFGLEWQSGALDMLIQKGDIVVVSGAPRTLSNMLLLIKARLKGAKTIWWGHYWSSTSNSWRAWLRLKLMTLADCAVFYTDLEVEEFHNRFGKRPSFPVFALNNGLENSAIQRLRQHYDDARERGKRLLFIGRLTAKSEFVLLLEALTHKGLEDVSIDVIGDGEQMQFFQSQAKALGVAIQVVWYGGSTDETAISAVANKCCLFVYPGAVGLSLIHGLSYGLPAIVHDNRLKHGPEIAALSFGENGLTFKKGDPQSLADVLLKSLSDQINLNRMSKAAIATTSMSYNVDDMAKRFCAAIKAVQDGNGHY